MRQVRYSQGNENAIDLVLFLNGLPVATVELKTDFTQSVDDAVDQYRFDRHPQPKGGVSEPLLSFPGGALVHFAVGQNEVAMTTKLAGKGVRASTVSPGNTFFEGGVWDQIKTGNPELYASALALMVEPEAACQNLERLAREGQQGSCGFYEAIDYTPSRLPPGASSVTVRQFMAHHEGMTLLSLAYVLLGLGGLACVLTYRKLGNLTKAGA